MRYVGDAHGKVKEYIAITKSCDESIQVGDMGIGFTKIPILSPEHEWIRGNHDDPNAAKKHPNCIKDGTFNEKTKTFFLGGAWSIDFQWRIEMEYNTGKRIWWPNEECSVTHLQLIIDYYEKCKPEIVVTHDCPFEMANQIRSGHQWDKSKTRQALSTMFEIHKPELWIAGHHHLDMKITIKGTKFICLDELSFVDI
jgi:hypothetical protein